MDTVTISKQKLDLDDAQRHLQGAIIKMQEDRQILLRAIEELEKGENILEGNSSLAFEARKIMRNLVNC